MQIDHQEDILGAITAAQLARSIGGAMNIHKSSVRNLAGRSAGSNTKKNVSAWMHTLAHSTLTSPPRPALPISRSSASEDDFADCAAETPNHQKHDQERITGSMYNLKNSMRDRGVHRRGGSNPSVMEVEDCSPGADHTPGKNQNATVLHQVKAQKTM
mmetsp:Transcript_17646/g.47698  ORF Transcript_17646/g.47698 Transcript_17646/m.47698 type:complete len:158 (+) Transcript_17646:183-656(+)